MLQTVSRRKLKLWPLVASATLVVFALAAFLFMRIVAAAPTLSATVDDSVTSGTNKFSYTGSWVNCGGCNPPAYNNGFRYAYTTGNSFTLTFTGTQAKIFGVKEPVGGIATVSIDGGTAVDVDYYASSQSIKNVYTTPVLAHGTHTVKFTVSGRKNAASSSPTINIDKAEIYVGGESDTTAPTTAITAPANNSAATIGDTVNIAATASDNVGVTKVEFLVNGSVVATDTEAPYSYAWSTTGKTAGSYALTTKAYDAAGNTTTSAAVNVTLNAPQAAITATATLSGNTATLSWTTTGSDPTVWTVARDGYDTGGTGAWSTTIAGSLRSHVFNYLRAGDTYTLTVSATDGRTASAIVTVPQDETPTPDTTAPTVSLTAPTNGTSATSGTAVTLSASASDNVGVSKVEFLVNGSVVNTDTSAPYSYSWSTTSTGSYTVAAKAYDAAGNTTTSAAVNVTLNAPQAAITATATLSGNTATLSWTTTGSDPTVWTVARDGYDTGGTGAWSTTIAGSLRSHVFNYLRAGDTYTLTVSAADGRTASASVTVPNTPPADTTAPTIALTSPTNGASVVKGDAVTIAANANDNVGVAKVEFLVNGNVVNTDTAAPYSYSWGTSNATVGGHTVTAKAYDAAGNVATSTAVQITITQPQTGQTATQRLWGQTPRSGKAWSSGVWTAAPFTMGAINQFENFRGSNVDMVTTYAYRNSPSMMNGDLWPITVWNGFEGKLNLGVPMAFNDGTTIQQVANGQYDANYRALAQAMVNNGRGDSLIRIGWEANLQDWKWQATTSNASTWKSAWRRIATQMKSVAPNLKMEFGVGCGAGLDGSSDRLAALTVLYPGDDLVDAVGCDIYDWWTTHPTSDANVATSLHRAPYGPGVLDIIDFAKSKGKLAGFAEWGLAKNTGGNNGGGDNPYFIQAMYNAVSSNADTVAYELYFNEADPYISNSLTNGVNPTAAAAYAARW